MSESSPILLFDGECKFCNFWISFIKRKNANTEFSYLPLQSVEGKRILKAYNVSKKLDSIIVIKNSKSYFKSSAALVIVSELGGMWTLVKIAYIIPKFIRDWAYDIVAKNRHKFFKSNNCELH